MDRYRNAEIPKTRKETADQNEIEIRKCLKDFLAGDNKALPELIKLTGLKKTDFIKC